MYCHAPVGEDSILLRSRAYQVSTLLGEFVHHWTRNHSTKHAKSIRWREADSLPYRRLYDFRVHSNHLPSYCRGG